MKGDAEAAEPAAEPEKDADDLLAEAKDLFALAEEREAHNRAESLDDLRFVRLREHWPATIVRQREVEGRPMLTIDKLGPFVRQVVNAGRQNRPQMQVHPVGTGADQETAEIINGLLRNIEVISDADTAYDTALEYAVSCGQGYLKVNTRYAEDDAFAQDLIIERCPDPSRIWGDPHSLAADSSDWNHAFELELVEVDDFKRRFPDAQEVDWDAGPYSTLQGTIWREGKRVAVLTWWAREEAMRTVHMLSSGEVVDADVLKEREDEFLEDGVTIEGTRKIPTHKVRIRTLTGAEVVDDRPWPGRYIPVIPVYGEDIVVEGKRHLSSLVRGAQRMYDYARSAEVEAVALAPKTPFIGPIKAFESELDKWETANTENHAFIGYDGGTAPERQPYAGPPAGWMTLAEAADGDMKAMLGMFDASMGENAANEQSGKAILALQASGDTSTFHFSDNQARAIRQCGRVLIDLIPHVYSGARVLRVMGADRKPQMVPVNQPVPVPGPNGQPQVQTDPAGQPVVDPISGQPIQVTKIYDLTVGKYDLTVEVGPGFATRREQAANQMLEVLKAYPAAAPVIAPELAKNMDWPGAEKLADGMTQIAQQEAQKSGPEGAQQAAQAEQAAAAAKAQGDQQLAQQKAASDAQLAQQRAEIDAKIAQQKLAAQIELDRQKAASDADLQRARMQADIEIQTRKAELEAELQRQRFALEASMKQRPDPVVPGGDVG